MKFSNLYNKSIKIYSLFPRIIQLKMGIIVDKLKFYFLRKELINSLSFDGMDSILKQLRKNVGGG